MQYFLAHPHTLSVFALSGLLAAIGLRSALRRPNRHAVPLLTAGGILVAQASLFWGFTVDDAFITYRFARSWAEGLGPVFQAGERVEGFTSLAWTALLALARGWGADLEAVGRGAGLIAAGLALPATSLLIRRWCPGSRAAGIAPIVLALDPLFIGWACAGMEAPLFAATLAWATWAFLSPPRAFPLDALLFGFLAWIRPEGLLFASIALGLVLLRRDHPRRTRWLVTLALLVTPLWAGRWIYYGDLLPNTFYVKTGFGTSRLMVGWHSVADFFGQTGVWMTLAVGVAILRGPWRESKTRFLPIAMGSFFAYVVWAGGDVLHLRFFVHVLPLWTALAAVGFVHALEALESQPARLPSPSALAVGLGVVLATVTFQATERALRARDPFGPGYVVVNASNIRRAHRPLGRWLREHVPPGSRVAAFDIGVLGYESGLPIVDLHGLTDRRLARLIHRRASADELVEELRGRDVGFLVLYGTSRGPVLNWLEAGADWVRRDFRMHSAWNDSDLDKGMVLLMRRDLDVAGPPKGKEPRSVEWQ